MEEVVISACPAGEINAALEVLHSSLPGRERQAMVASMRSWLETAPEACAGVWVARGGGGIRGAVLVQPQPGRTAVLWPPATSPIDRDLELRLALVADEHLARGGPLLAQCLFPDATDPRIAVVETIGFSRLAELEYLVAEARARTTVGDAGQLRFEAYRPSERQRLAVLLEATYVDTLDCPQLDGTRDIEDVIAGYEATGAFDPGNWFFVSQGGHDIGLVLLTEHPGADQWELVYMGLVPEVRGKGLGTRIVEFALHRAFQAGIESILLAVDMQNRYAVDLYHRLGFRVWNHRIVYWKIY